jgi:hypothetical protein
MLTQDPEETQPDAGEEVILSVEPGQDIITSLAKDGESQAIAHDAFDVAAHEEALANYKRLGETQEKHGKKLATAPALMRDVFFSMYQRAPRLNPAEGMSYAHRPNHKIIEQMMSTTEWQQVREAGTSGDELTSAMATIGVTQKVLSALIKIP